MFGAWHIWGRIGLPMNGGESPGSICHDMSRFEIVARLRNQTLLELEVCRMFLWWCPRYVLNPRWHGTEIDSHQSQNLLFQISRAMMPPHSGDDLLEFVFFTLRMDVFPPSCLLFPLLRAGGGWNLWSLWRWSATRWSQGSPIWTQWDRNSSCLEWKSMKNHGVLDRFIIGMDLKYLKHHLEWWWNRGESLQTVMMVCKESRYCKSFVTALCRRKSLLCSAWENDGTYTQLGKFCKEHDGCFWCNTMECWFGFSGIKPSYTGFCRLIYTL